MNNNAAKSDSASCSAFILHWNRPNECARTVGLFLKEPKVTVRVLDNGSDSKNLERLQALLPSCVQIIKLEKNRGWGGGHNVGLAQWLEKEKTSYCFVAAHDAVPVGDCLGQMIHALNTNPKVGMLCPQYENGDIGVFSPVLGPRVISSPQGAPGAIRQMDFIHGTLMLFRRDCLKEIGLFDERYFAYGDEFDLSMRARKLGWEVGMLYGAQVVNPETSVAKPLIIYLCTRGTLLLARDYGGRISAATRACLIVINTLRLSVLRRSESDAFQAKAKLGAVLDYYRGRFGAPKRRW